MSRRRKKMRSGHYCWCCGRHRANERFSGRVTKIGNSSIRPRTSAGSTGSDQAIDFEVRITLDAPPPGVRPDLSATADVITDTRRDVVAIPISALTLVDADDIEPIPNENLPEGASNLTSTGDVEGVYVVDGEEVRFRPVSIGISGERHFEVLTGLDVDEVVVSGTFQAIRELTDGARINITAADTARAEGSEVADRNGDDAS